MADGNPPDSPAPEAPPPAQPEPPPLDSIRVSGPGARGLNKPGILGAAAIVVTLVLVLTSGVFSSDPARKPADTKPLMSDPARPEMAKGAIRNLPVDYTQVTTPQQTVQPAAPPQLGPPLPGDIAAFAQAEPQLRSYSSAGEPDWGNPAPHTQHADVAPEETELRQADRSGLFFALRTETSTGETSQPSQGAPPQAPSSRLTAFAASPPPSQPQNPDSDHFLFPGAILSASLITEVNSESPGPVIAQITQAVFDSAEGRTLLIPQGARLIGEYKASTRYGESRIGIIWSRLIMPNGREIELAEAALDPAGAAGVSGAVDNHWLDVLGAAAVGTLINVGVATTEDPAVYGNGYGARDPVDAAVSDGVQRMASSVTNRVVARGLAIPPTIRVPAGAKLAVIVTRRLAL